MDRTTVRLLIRGRVQGVGYRWWTRAEALRLDLDGWVRNRADGAVEVVASGPAPRVAELIALCRRGPAGAGVTNVDQFDAEAPPLPGFDVLADTD
jgi:acylphosphatase